VWVQNKEHTWWNATRGEVTPVGAAEITLGGLEPGSYEVEQWDTYTGKVQSSRVTSKDGTVTLVTPAGLSKDVAYKVRPAKS
jgi:hypothetical protein